jgi:hypothetical protein
MLAKSIHGQTPADIQQALEQSMADGFSPTLAFVFISISNDLSGVSALLNSRQIQIFGATTGGEFIDENISSGGIAILLMDMNPRHFRILLDDYRDQDTATVATRMAEQAKEIFNNPSFIISASIGSQDISELSVGEPIIRAIESVTGPDTIIWGGRAGDDFAFGESIVFTNNHAAERSILLLVLDGDHIILRGTAASGQKPVGTAKTITKAEGKWVYEIDHQPATDIILKYLGLTLTQEEAKNFFPKEGIMFSLLRDKGDPVMRGVGLFNWEDKSFSTLGLVQEGDQIRLTLPPDFEVIDEVHRNAEKIKAEEIAEADALLMFSCVGRLGQFGPIIGEEIEGVRKVFDAPMAGFFTYGEFGRSKNGNNELHTSTCCWVAIKENAAAS